MTERVTRKATPTTTRPKPKPKPKPKKKPTTTRKIKGGQNNNKISTNASSVLETAERVLPPDVLRKIHNTATGVTERRHVKQWISNMAPQSATAVPSAGNDGHPEFDLPGGIRVRVIPGNDLMLWQRIDGLPYPHVPDQSLGVPENYITYDGRTISSRTHDTMTIDQAMRDPKWTQALATFVVLLQRFFPEDDPAKLTVIWQHPHKARVPLTTVVRSVATHHSLSGKKNNSASQTGGASTSATSNGTKVVWNNASSKTSQLIRRSNGPNAPRARTNTEKRMNAWVGNSMSQNAYSRARASQAQGHSMQAPPQQSYPEQRAAPAPVPFWKRLFGRKNT